MKDAIKQRTDMTGKGPEIIECLKRGYSITDTCQIVDIARETLYWWLREAESPTATDEQIQPRWN